MFGIRNIWRFAALVAFGAVVAPVTAAPTQSTSLQASPPVVVQVSPALNHATFNVKTGRASRITIFFGTDRANMISKEVSTFSISRSVRLTPLAPATKYYYNVVATDRSGKLVGRRVGAFVTGAIRPAKMSVVNGKFRLNGVPFFPIMANTYNCPTEDVVSGSSRMGINVMDFWWGNGGCTDYENGRTSYTPTVSQLHSLLKNRVWWLPRDEPETPAGLPEMLSLTGELHLELSAGDLWGCQGADNSAGALHDRLRTSVTSRRRNGIATVYYAVVTATGGVRSCFNAQRFSAQFWTAIIADASGTEYVHTYPSRPDDGIDVRQDVAIQAGIDAARLKTLYPVILAGATSTATSSNDNVIVRSWTWGGNVYTVAVNTENKKVTTTLKWPGRTTDTVEVMWQDRSKKLVAGGISERFDAHEVHIYRLP